MDMEAILWKYGHKQGLCLRDDKIDKWPYEDPIPNNDEIEVIVGDYRKHLMEEKINLEAKKRIIAIYPDYKQRNIIIDKLIGNGEEKFAEMKSFISKIRLSSDALINTLYEMDLSEIDSFDPANNAYWD